ncbi:NUDIX hydrolase [Microbacterium sp. NPDC028030]|uniref:NUDIX hydrolase n=1 Tax=Microbacterium sp. NPDC028030 TaxID=3155124 RepID=UPI0033FAF82E
MGWVTHRSESKYENLWIRVREDTVSGPNGADGIYGVVATWHPAVFIVAVDDEDRMCLITIDRYTVGVSTEIPAGGSDGEEPLAAAKRELREETGYEADDWTSLGSMYALNGIAEAREHVFLARGVRPLPSSEDAAASQAEEGIREVSWVPFERVLRMIAAGDVTDGETIAAVAKAGIALGRFR